MQRLIFNAFVMNSPVHLSPGSWRRSGDTSHRHTSLAHWTELAALLELGRFDALFIADTFGMSDVYGGSPDAALRGGIQVPLHDPLLIVSAMAQATRHLSFGVTCSTTYEAPFALARRFSTLDHLSNGRIGWNVVTSASDSAARNFGLDRQLDHASRYARAEEFLDVCYKLWEQSWEEDALMRDAQRGVFVDPSRVHRIAHRGEYFSVDGPHLVEPSPQRTPVLYQAGASRQGRAFAARHAECVFVGAPSKAALKETVSKLRSAFAEAGRDPASIPIVAEHTVITGITRTEAFEKLDEYRRYASGEGALALMSGWTGVDLSKAPLDAPFTHRETEAIQSAIDAMTSADPDRVWTVREIAQWTAIGGLSPVSVGDPEEIADALQSWAAETGVDGFNLSYAAMDQGFRDFVDLVVPVLQTRGVYQRDYAPGTFRDKLFGRGPRLGGGHPAAAYRGQPADIDR